MNSKNTWQLLALAAGLFTYIMVFEWDGLDDHQPVASTALFPDLKVPSVTRVEITVSNQTVRAERVNGHWTLAAPVAYPAQGTAIESLLLGGQRLRPHTRIPMREVKKQPGGLADFGLQPPRARLALQQGTQHFQLNVGSRTPAGSQFYAQLGDAKEIIVADAALLDLFPRSADDWRAKELLNLDGLAFDRLEVRPRPPGFVVQRDATNRLWRLTYPMETRADNPKLNHLLELAQKWEVQQFVTDNPQADLEPFGLQKPEAELVFGQGTNDALVVQFGKSPTNNPALVFARRLSHTNIVLVPRELLDAFRAPHTSFRDRRLLAFNPNAVDAIEVRGEENFTLRRATNGAWRVAPPFDLSADPALVRSLLIGLGELEAVEFVKDVVTDFTEFGLDKPARQFTLNITVTNAAGAATNAALAQISFGKIPSPDKIFARRGDEIPVYAVALGDSQRLPAAAFQLRDRRVWSFDETNVLAVVIRQHGQTRRIVRSGEISWSLNGPGTINPAAVEETVHRLGELRAAAWTARGEDSLARYGVTETAHDLTLEVKRAERTETLTVAFGRRGPNFNMFAATTLDGQKILFEFPVKLFEEFVSPYLSIPVP
ncbi:MAG: DUF4340 domain-containing protein [Verrucomicrobia bacterium]|nr:DUF4340 domain-containing protein [Verrucomicrobiota bacterium]